MREFLSPINDFCVPQNRSQYRQNGKKDKFLTLFSQNICMYQKKAVTLWLFWKKTTSLLGHLEHLEQLEQLGHLDHYHT